MSKRLVASALTVFISAALLLAHGNATHIMGTVTAIDGNHVTVKTQDGKSEMVMLEKVTKYLIGSKSATVADLKVGTRVVVDAKMDEKMKMYKAEEVKIGAAPAAKPAAAHADHK
jgi:exosome complex RNA-binding protein Rrp42 (RNase PH superfamily)